MADLAVLNDSVLVLNKNYAVINVVRVLRAISMLSRGRAEVVYVEDGYYKSYSLENWFDFSLMKRAEALEDNSYIEGIEKTLMVPKIIRTMFFDKVPKRNVVLSRRSVYLRDNHQCQFCGKKYPDVEINIDHLIPKSRGGHTTWTNVVCSCIKCNSRKGNKTPEEAGMKLLKKPFVPHYNLTIYEQCKEPKYKTWQNFLDDIYYNIPLKE